MIVHNVVQGSSDWLSLRCGIPTASNFHRILTPGGKPSGQAESYMHELLAEIMMGHPLEDRKTPWMEHGNEMEPHAVELFEFQNDVDTVPVGFMTNDAGTIGASPDRLMGEDELLEVKSPSPEVHAGYLLSSIKGVDDKYMLQLQGQLWISERKAVTIISYHREMPMAVVRVERKQELIDKISAAVTTFAQVLATNREMIDAKGWIKPKEKEAAADFAEFVTMEDVDAILEARRK